MKLCFNSLEMMVVMFNSYTNVQAAIWLRKLLIQIKLLLEQFYQGISFRSSLIRVYTICHSASTFEDILTSC